MRKNQTSPALPRMARNSTSRLSNLPKESTGRTFWPTATRDQSGMPERLWPVEPLIVSSHSRTPPPPPKLKIHFFNIFSLLDPLLLHPSSFPRLRRSLQFYQHKCPPHWENPPTHQPLAQLVFLTLSGSKSRRPTSGSFHLC